MAFYNKNIKDIFYELQSSKQGISESSVLDRIEKYGNNQIEEQKNPGFFKRFLMEFKNIMIIILIISAIISLVLAITNHDPEN